MGISKKFTMRLLDPMYILNASTYSTDIDSYELASNVERSILVLLYDLFSFTNYKIIIEFMMHQDDYQEYENGLILKSKNFIAIQYEDDAEKYYYIHLMLGSKNRCTFNIAHSSINYIDEYLTKIESLLFKISTTGNLYTLKEVAGQYIKWLYSRTNPAVPIILLKDNESGTIATIRKILYTDDSVREFLEKIMDEEGIVYDKL